MKLVAYQRVSTARQGRSGLGLEAQVAAVEAYARQNGADIAATYTEVESGKKADRPKLHEAIGHANLVGATLIVAKLDRLSRSVSFLATLMESGVAFIAADNPSSSFAACTPVKQTASNPSRMHRLREFMDLHLL